MKVINQARMLLAEWLLSLILWIVPKNKEGLMLVAYITKYVAAAKDVSDSWLGLLKDKDNDNVLD